MVKKKMFLDNAINYALIYPPPEAFEGNYRWFGSPFTNAGGSCWWGELFGLGTSCSIPTPLPEPPWSFMPIAVTFYEWECPP